jgi:hypothetical protein
MIRNTVQVFFQRIEDDHLWALPSGGPINDHFIRLHDYIILKSMIYNLYQSNSNFPFVIKKTRTNIWGKEGPKSNQEEDVVTLELLFRPLSNGDKGTFLIGSVSEENTYSHDPRCNTNKEIAPPKQK